MEDCAICLESLAFNRRKIHVTECNHKFHFMCFKRMMVSICPCCRAPVTLCEVNTSPINLKIKRLEKQLSKEYEILFAETPNDAFGIFWKSEQYRKIQAIRESLIRANEELGN